MYLLSVNIIYSLLLTILLNKSNTQQIWILCRKNYLYTLKFIAISTKKENIQTLNLLFDKQGFSYCYEKSKFDLPKVHRFNVQFESQWEKEVIKELEVNLKLRRNFEKVNIGFISSFFNLVPNLYSELDTNELLNFSEAEFENNALLSGETHLGLKVIYGTSQLLIDKLKELYKSTNFIHSAQVLFNTIKLTNDETLHLSLNSKSLEILVFRGDELKFYNLFEALVDEDILFYTLFTLEQMNLSANKIEVKTYGELLPKTKVYQTLKKYIRHVNTAMKDEEFLLNYILYNLEKCELSQGLLKEEKS